jgi:hypothetical protein
MCKQCGVPEHDQTEHPDYSHFSLEMLVRAIEGQWVGLSSTGTHKQRFALAELARRAGLIAATRSPERPNE